MAEAIEFKFGVQLGSAKAHHKITSIGKSGHGFALGELPKMLRFHFNIYTMVEGKEKGGEWEGKRREREGKEKGKGR